MRKLLVPIGIFCLIGGSFAVLKPGDERFSGVSTVFIVGLAMPALVAFIKSSLPHKSRKLLLLSALAYLFEGASIRFGVPYGYFSYGPSMGYRLWDLVPWTVPFAWVPLVIGAATMAQRLSGKFLSQLLYATAILVGLDLVLDPVSVHLGFWTYRNPGIYYGVPFTNYLGWFFSGLVGCTVLLHGDTAGPSYRLPPYGTYSVIWMLLFWSAVAFWFRLWIPLAIAVMLLALVSRLLSTRPPVDDSNG